MGGDLSLSELKLHPDVEKFKEFVESNPEIIREARSGVHDLNYYFKHYQKYGEDDSFWDQFNENETDDSSDDKKKKKGWTEQLKGLFDKIEVDQIDTHLKQADSAITELKKLISHFSELRDNKSQSGGPSLPPTHPPAIPPQIPMGGMNRRFF